MNTANLRRLLDEATPRPWDGRHIFDGENVIQHGHDVFRCHVAITQTEVDMDLIVELVNNADELLAESERLRAALIFIRDKEQAALNEAERLRFNIPEEAGCMEIFHAARAALEQKP